MDRRTIAGRIRWGVALAILAFALALSGNGRYVATMAGAGAVGAMFGTALAGYQQHRRAADLRRRLLDVIPWGLAFASPTAALTPLGGWSLPGALAGAGVIALVAALFWKVDEWAGRPAR